MELKTVGLTKEFGSKIAVDDLNITLANGVYGLLGANGAGKTTLMRLLCNIQNPTSGKILLNGKNVLGIKNVVLLVGGMIGSVFALVGLINFINLVMTNIVTRRHEFATMQSIGMTNRQLRKMMISESFSYVLLAGIVGTLVAATLGMTLLRAFVENGPTSMMMTFQITLLPALIMLILFLALAFIVPVVALRLFNNRSVVERLRVNE